MIFRVGQKRWKSVALKQPPACHPELAKCLRDVYIKDRKHHRRSYFDRSHREKQTCSNLFAAADVDSRYPLAGQQRSVPLSDYRFCAFFVRVPGYRLV